MTIRAESGRNERSIARSDRGESRIGAGVPRGTICPAEPIGRFSSSSWLATDRLVPSGPARMTAMAEERLTEIPTSWTTISSAHYAWPQEPGGHGGAGRPIPRRRHTIHPPEGPRQAPGRRGPPGVLDQALDRQARRSRQEQGTISRLSADGPPPADHRPLPHAKAAAAPARRPAGFQPGPTRISTASGARP